jgi:hypothetical protein
MGHADRVVVLVAAVREDEQGPAVRQGPDQGAVGHHGRRLSHDRIVRRAVDDDDGAININCAP